DDSAVPALVESLSDSSKNVQRCGAEALTKIGQAAVEPLLDALIGKDQSARKWAAEALGERCDSRVFHALVIGDGTVTLGMLQEKIERWIAEST
ncbi:MAG: HEAT repeat domain-containing protein, partial [marine benthic group bacterium]|nr:HEAT repeat domain-containing protein [Gemmatimonadota bacterium]